MYVLSCFYESLLEHNIGNAKNDFKSSLNFLGLMRKQIIYEGVDAL